jgi:hypothetical protein
VYFYQDVSMPFSSIIEVRIKMTVSARNLFMWTTTGTMIGAAIGLAGEYIISDSLCYLPNNYTTQDLSVFKQCRGNLINSLGVDPSHPGLINGFFNAINLPFIAIGTLVGFGCGLYYEIKRNQSINAVNSVVRQPDVEEGRELKSSQSQSVEKEGLRETDNELSIFKTAQTSYEIDNGDLCSPAKIGLFKQTPKIKHSQDDFAVPSTRKHMSLV